MAFHKRSVTRATGIDSLSSSGKETAHLTREHRNQFVVCTEDSSPVVVQVNGDGTTTQTPVTLPTEGQTAPSSKSRNEGGGGRRSTIAPYHAVYDHRGTHLYIGTAKGLLHVVETRTRAVVRTLRVASSAIRSILMHHRGRDMLIHTNDRVLRRYAIPNTHKSSPANVADEEMETEVTVVAVPEPRCKYVDPVDRNQWAACAFTADGDFIIAARKASHHLSVWDREAATLVSTLQGPSGSLEDVTVRALEKSSFKRVVLTGCG